jgi:hypothetical protein
MTHTTQETQTNEAACSAASADPHNAKPNLDVQAQIDAALKGQQAAFAEQLHHLTGHSDIKTLHETHAKEKADLQALADGYKTKFEQSQIHYAILAECAEAISPTFIKELLSGKAVCDEHGHVTIAGKPVADAVKNLLDANPFLAKAQGGTGSGAPTHSGTQAPETKRITRAEYERLSPPERGKFINSGGKITD